MVAQSPGRRSRGLFLLLLLVMARSGTLAVELWSDERGRRGVDAFRAQYRLSATSSAECIGAFGETWEQSALLGEYHYSDFGVEDAEDTLIRLQDPDFQERLMNIITFFAPYTQPSLIEQPTKRCFHHVAKLPEGAAIDRIAFGDQPRGLTLTQRLTNLIFDVIGAIRQHFVRTSAGTSVWLWWNMGSDTLP